MLHVKKVKKALGEEKANKKAIIGDHDCCIRMDGPACRGFCSSTQYRVFSLAPTKHQSITSLEELFKQTARTVSNQSQEAVLCWLTFETFPGLFWRDNVSFPCPQSSLSLIVRKSQNEFIHLCNREFQPWNQFTQLCLSPITQLVLFLLWPLPST